MEIGGRNDALMFLDYETRCLLISIRHRYDAHVIAADPTSKAYNDVP